MRVFTKNVYGFRDPENPKILYRTVQMGFSEVPDFAAKDPIFEAGVKAGDIEVIASRPMVQAADAPTGVKTPDAPAKGKGNKKNPLVPEGGDKAPESGDKAPEGGDKAPEGGQE